MGFNIAAFSSKESVSKIEGKIFSWNELYSKIE